MQGPYVLVLVARGERGTGPEDERRSRLPAMWLIKAYSRLTRPYKKNVRHSWDPLSKGFRYQICVDGNTQNVRDSKRWSYTARGTKDLFPHCSVELRLKEYTLDPTVHVGS